MGKVLDVFLKKWKKPCKIKGLLREKKRDE